ncbi:MULTISPECIES: hypothetical protein [unclassified Paenibacillus]|nr:MULTISPECIES: hypothetical protein [unclassified Paenibacillus]
MTRFEREECCRLQGGVTRPLVSGTSIRYFGKSALEIRLEEVDVTI